MRTKKSQVRLHIQGHGQLKFNVCIYGNRSNAILEMIMKGEYLQTADPDVTLQNAALFATINTLFAMVDK